MDPIQAAAEQSGELGPEYTELARRLEGRLDARLQGAAPGAEANGALLPERAVSEAKASDTGLTADEEQIVKQMRARDAEVRRHEEAHATVGGQYAGAPSYTYQTGPDAKRYAVGGEVPIDVAPVRDDPEATIEKMEVVKAAALAPAEPSGADRRVAALAESQRAQAVAELFRERAEAGPGGTADQASASAAYGDLSPISSTLKPDKGISRAV